MAILTDSHRSSTPTSTAPPSGTACAGCAAYTTPRWSQAVGFPLPSPPSLSLSILPPLPKPTPPTALTHTPGFRPPSHSPLRATDLELYTIRNDGWCLVTLALILLSLTSAIPLSQTTPSSQTIPSPSTASKAVPTPTPNRTNPLLPHARAIIAATVLHHLATGVGAWQHYKLASHYNTAMGIGVWGNVWLVGAGVFTLLVGMVEEGRGVRGEVERKVR